MYVIYIFKKHIGYKDEYTLQTGKVLKLIIHTI